MKTIFNMAMRKATKLAKSQHVIEATRVIQHAIGGLNRNHLGGKGADLELTKKHRDLGERPEPAAALHAGMAHSLPGPEHAKPLGEVLASLQRVNRQPSRSANPRFHRPSPPVPAMKARHSVARQVPGTTKFMSRPPHTGASARCS